MHGGPLFDHPIANDISARIAALDHGTLVLHAPPGFGKSAIAALARERARHVTVVEELTGDDLDAVLPRLSSRLADGCLLVTTSDALVASQISLRFPGQATVFTAQDLRLGADDVAAQLGCEVRDARVDRIMSLSGGWPLVARLTVADEGLSEATLAERLNCYFDMLEGEYYDAAELRAIAVVADLDELRVSVLRSLFGDETIVETLRKLARRGAFVYEMASPATTFALEPAFTSYLKRRFDGLRPDGVAASKAVGLARLGYVGPAIRIASLSRDETCLAEVIGLIGGLRTVMSLGYDSAPVFDLPALRTSDHPEVIVARVYMEMQLGRIAHARELLDAASSPCGDRREHKSLGLVDLALRLYENHDIPLEDILAFEQRHADALYDDPIARATIQQIRASSHYLRADYAGSFACARYAMEVSVGLGAPLLAHYAKFYVALNQMRSGHADQARDLLESTLAMSERELGANNPQARQAALLLARIYLEQMEFETAEDLISCHAPLAELYANWRDAAEVVITTQARLIHRARGTTAALSYLDERQTAYFVSGMPVCSYICVLLKAQILFEAARYEDAEQELDALVPTTAGHHPGLILAEELLRIRIAFSRTARPGPGDDWPALRARIAASGDSALQIRAAMHDFERLHGEGDAAAANEALRTAVLQAHRCGLMLTFESEALRGGGAAVRAAADCAFGAEEQDFIRRCCAAASGAEPASVPAPPPSGLSPRERQVLGYLADGLSSKEMARNLNISVGTVKGYRRKLYDKLNIYRRSDAVLAARQLGLGQTLMEGRI
jgi:ATP/maltotriose-dependent transcriptional regulator MalT